MSYLDEKIHDLQEKIVEKRRLEAELKDLQEQRIELEDKVALLEKARNKEQLDVDRLEGRSLAAFFYNVVGKKDEKLDKERREAYEANVKYDVAFKEFEMVEDNIARRMRNLEAVNGCEEAYHNAINEKLEMLKENNIPEAQEIISFEQEIVYLDGQEREIAEAISATRVAIKTLDMLNKSLKSAKDWGTWDILGGDGIFSHMAKHGHLDDAQDYIEEFQVQLRRVKTELADISMNVNININISGLMRFADYFFDNIFVDWEMQNRIDNAIQQVISVKSQLKCVIDKLERMKEDVYKRKYAIKMKIESIIIRTQI